MATVVQTSTTQERNDQATTKEAIRPVSGKYSGSGTDRIAQAHQ